MERVSLNPTAPNLLLLETLSRTAGSPPKLRRDFLARARTLRKPRAGGSPLGPPFRHAAFDGRFSDNARLGVSILPEYGALLGAVTRHRPPTGALPEPHSLSGTYESNARPAAGTRAPTEFGTSSSQSPVENGRCLQLRLNGYPQRALSNLARAHFEGLPLKAPPCPPG